MGRRSDKEEHDIALVREAVLMERVINQRFALAAIWGSVEGDKKWRKKNPTVARIVEETLKEGE